MKKLAKGILTVGLVGLLAFGATACNEVVNAYDIAVKNGFKGTEKEWLLSLQGEKGADGADLDAQVLYEAAKAEGFEGSFLDFCATLNITVPQNTDTVQIAENMTSVVSIHCGYSVTKSSSGWFGQLPSTKKEYGYSSGSGVIVDINKEAGSAYIITNYHVVYNLDCDQKGILKDCIWVYPYGAYNAFDPRTGGVNDGGIQATYVGGAMDYDIAVLKIEGSEKLKNSVMTEAKIGDSNTVKPGEQTFVIGNPAGAGIAVTNGVISVPSEYISMYALDNRDANQDGEVDIVPFRVMRTSAAINGGNSGGGMFNADGELIGIVNAKNAQSTTDNMGYALPITQVKAMYDNILANGGQLKKATLGITVGIKSSNAVLDQDGNISVVEEFYVSQAATYASQASYMKLYSRYVFLSGRVNDGAEKVFVQEHELTDLLLTVRKGDTVTFRVRNTDGVEESIAIPFDKDSHFTVYA